MYSVPPVERLRQVNGLVAWPLRPVREVHHLHVAQEGFPAVDGAARDEQLLVVGAGDALGKQFEFELIFYCFLHLWESSKIGLKN